MDNERLQENYGTLSETVTQLNRHGYTHDFNIQGECIVCHTKSLVLSPDDFQIDKVYRFEGASNPDDAAIVYAISSGRFGVKGVLVNGYGISAEEMPAKLVQKLQTSPTDTTPKPDNPDSQA